MYWSIWTNSVKKFNQIKIERSLFHHISKINHSGEILAGSVGIEKSSVYTLLMVMLYPAKDSSVCESKVLTNFYLARRKCWKMKF